MFANRKMQLKFVNKLIILLTLICNVTSLFNDQSWTWSWQCNDNTGLCEKSTLVSYEKHHNKNEINSQSVCRLTCGRYGALWPIPTTSTEIHNKLINIHPKSFSFKLVDSTPKSLELFDSFTKIFLSNLNSECGGECIIPPTLANVAVRAEVKNHDTMLHFNVDESYVLQVTNTDETNVEIKITAESLYGSRHALETLSQLIASYTTNISKLGREKSLIMIASARIEDKPVFKHRGLLVDTARNYLTPKSIKKQLDAMAASKMNVFHWHATDSQSLPVNFKSIPQMSRYGAYSGEEVYTEAQITDIVLYAKSRGIRILFELDQPSHAGNGWQWGPDYEVGNLAVCINKMPWRQYCIQPPCGQLNPANKNVYRVLHYMYKDILDMIPSAKDYFHMGGDEVFINCWNSTSEIVSYMESKGMGRTTEDFLKLWAEFQENSKQSFDEITNSNSTPIILWSSQLTEPEHIEKYLSKDRYVIQTWVPTTNDLPAKLLEKGYRLIISTKNAWYLDHGFWGSTQYYNWRTVYKNLIPTHKGVLGGEACMWGEYVDENSIDSRIWPRVAAVAERLWANPSLSSESVEPRFYRHKERLIQRGINADAVTPGWCVQNEGQCR